MFGVNSREVTKRLIRAAPSRTPRRFVGCKKVDPNFLAPLPETCKPVPEYFGINVFDYRAMSERISGSVLDSFYSSVDKFEPVTATTADTMAKSLLRWALERGATHYTHWFQPLTGSTAEKHDTFFDLTPQGVPINRFRGKDLIMSEPDGSSFPSGGLRRTHTARAYSVWDVNSPPFILNNGNGATLYIPSVFFSWYGDFAIDDKIPLLRSDVALAREAIRFFKVIGDDRMVSFHTDSGLEQEFFLIDRELYLRRPDLINCGRTVLGALPPKGQELEDHYFCLMSRKMIDAFHQYEVEMWKLGIPVMTRHSEVAPGQYETAPKFARSGLATDRNLLQMHVLRRVAREHGLAALLAEKPFAGVNGSGKHNNWSFGTNIIPTLLEPGDHPQTNTYFMLFLATTLSAVDKHQDLLRIAISGAGNDHRLGANEAPPAIMSAFLGTDIDDAVKRFIAEDTSDRLFDRRIDLGIPSLPIINRQLTDRNRTSPFAFTGNKFEFRAVGSSQTAARSNTILNTIMAEALRDVTNDVQAEMSKGKSAEEAVKKVARARFIAHSRIIFNGDGYSQEWREEAAKRGLNNFRTTPEALARYTDPKNMKLFEDMKVFKKDEVIARKHVFEEEYKKRVFVEARTMTSMARNGVVPAVINFQAQLSGAIGDCSKHVPSGLGAQKRLLQEVAGHLDKTLDGLNALDKALHDIHQDCDDTLKEAFYCQKTVIPIMDEIRINVDKLETLMPSSSWPFPTYYQMLFHQD